MTLWQHATQKRWLGYLAVAVAFAVITSMFGLWQWDRRQQAVAEIQRVNSHYDLPAVAVGEVLSPEEPWTDRLKWRPVTVSGRYLPETQLLVRTRPRFGSVGFDVVVVFEETSGRRYLVSRGWVPTGRSQDEPDIVPAPPSGLVTVVGRMLPSEPLIGGRSAPEGQVATIHLGTIAELTGQSIDPRFFLALESESPQPDVAPLVWERPSPNEGPHLSYTFQWFLFGVLGFVAWGYLLREDYRRQQGLPGSGPRPRRASDQEEEDSLIDRAERSA